MVQVLRKARNDREPFRARVAVATAAYRDPEFCSRSKMRLVIHNPVASVTLDAKPSDFVARLKADYIRERRVLAGRLAYERRVRYPNA